MPRKRTVDPAALFQQLASVRMPSMLTVPEEHIRSTLHEHADSLGGATGGWLAPLGTLLALLIPIVTTATYADAFGLSGATWRLLIRLGAIATAGWLGVAVIFIFVRKSRKQAIDDVIAALRPTGDDEEQDDAAKNERDTA